jgi:hypothetical protein
MDQTAKHGVRQFLTRIGELGSSGSVWYPTDLRVPLVHF